nr:hypothetical protein [Tanacetum cinerariifolium]
MIPLSEKRVYRFKDKGKRPRLSTLTPFDTESSDSPFLTPRQGVENDPVENYTLDLLPYMNQLHPSKEEIIWNSSKLMECSSAYSIFSPRRMLTPQPKILKEMARTDFIEISSNESSPIQNHLTNASQPLNITNTTFITNPSTTLDTTLALTTPPPTSIQTTLTLEPLMTSLAPRALTFSTPLSSPLEPHPYVSSLNEIPPRTTNPLPQVMSQGLSQTPPTITHRL